jgi:hypothetical protein
VPQALDDELLDPHLRVIVLPRGSPSAEATLLRANNARITSSPGRRRRRAPGP